MLLLAALIGVPLIEIGIFIEVGGFIGLWPTLGLVVATAMLGSWQLRAQGLATLARARAQMDEGRLPARELFDAFCLVIAGALLLTPGFLTDVVGLALFIPAVRAFIRQALARRLRASEHMQVWVDGEPIKPGGPGGTADPRSGIIEGEYRDVSDKDPDNAANQDSAADPDEPKPRSGR